MTAVSPSEQLTEHVRTHYNALYDYGLKLTNHDEDLTKDAIQDVFAAFWHHRAEWPRIQSVRAYLLMAVRNRITDVRRAGQRFVPLLTFPDTDESEPAPAFSFFDEPPTDTSAPARHLARAFEQLARRQREALFLRYYQELDYAEVARVMGVKERTVYNLVHEGLRQLRHHLMPARWMTLAGLGAGIVLFLKNSG